MTNLHRRIITDSPLTLHQVHWIEQRVGRLSGNKAGTVIDLACRGVTPVNIVRSLWSRA